MFASIASFGQVGYISFEATFLMYSVKLTVTFSAAGVGSGKVNGYALRYYRRAGHCQSSEPELSGVSAMGRIVSILSWIVTAQFVIVPKLG